MVGAGDGAAERSGLVRTFRIEGVFTTAATGTFMAFVRALTNRPGSAETRRDAGVLVCLLPGATGGGLLLAHAHLLARVLPFVITLLVVVTAAIGFRERGVQEEQDRRKVA